MNLEERARLSARLARLGAGERSHATPVFETLWPIVRRFCERWLQGAAEADDCAQRAITRVFAQAALFDSSRDALTWALELAAWECRTERTRVRRSMNQPMSDLNALSDDSFEVLERRALSAALLAAMTDLPEADRAELERLFSEELAGDAAARKRRQRAIERLKLLWRRLHGAD